MQTHETLNNIRAVIDEAGWAGFEFSGSQTSAAFKVYVRHAEHLEVVRNIISDEWGSLAQLIVLQADICRVDLLVEIEAVCWSAAS